MGRELHRRLGENVRAVRRARGLSQEQLGEAIGRHRTYVGAIERSERNPTLTTVEDLADRLGVDPVALLCSPEVPASSSPGAAVGTETGESRSPDCSEVLVTERVFG